MTESKRTGRFRPGESGNPRGRPRGASPHTKLRADLAEHVPGILQKLAAQALAGDPQCMRLVLERVLPPLKHAEQPTPVALPEGADLTTKGEAVLRAVADGELAPTQGAQLLSAIAGLARVAELDDVVRRLQALESKLKGDAS